jgi:tRNA-Thr(GGU) m(6)t(6)A37 methyltransferase TsaA
MPYCFKPIGVIHSCFKEKFGIPRQGNLIPESKARIEITPPFNQPSAFKGLESFSHIWIVFVFHVNPANRWRSTVRPPRLGGNRRIGVFASRSGFRPNPIGLSQVELEKVYQQNGRLYLKIKRIDLLDGTPVLDIKPYLPWADKPSHATTGFASTPLLSTIKLHFSSHAEDFFKTLPKEKRTHTRTLITQMLQNDPRPAIDRDRFRQKEYGTRIYDWNIRWEAYEDIIYVISIMPINSATLTI